MNNQTAIENCSVRVNNFLSLNRNRGIAFYNFAEYYYIMYRCVE